MIDQDRTDGADADLEALLRATFSSEARNQVSDTRPVPPFPATERVATVHPLRRRWVGLSVVAASLVAVAVAATVIGTEAMDADRTPTPAGTSVVPAPTVSEPVPTPSGSTTPTSTAPATTTAASTPPAPTTKQVTVQGVVLTVPVAWNAVPGLTDAGSHYAATCLTTDDVYRDDDAFADNCEVSVSVGPTMGGLYAVDNPGWVTDARVCPADGDDALVRTTRASELTVDGAVAEYRQFSPPCASASIDQWTVPTSPFVQFVRRPATPDATAAAQVLAMVSSARLPGPRSALRLTNYGVVVAISADAVTVDRRVLRTAQPDLDEGDAPAVLPLAPDVTIRYVRVGSDPFSTALTIAETARLVAGATVTTPDGRTVPALTTTSAFFTTDGTQVTSIEYFVEA